MSQVKQTVIFFGVRLISALASLGFIVVATRFLDPSDLGFYGLWLTLAALVASLGFQWIRFSYLYFTSAKIDVEDSARTAAIRSVATIAVVILVFGSLLTWIYGPSGFVLSAAIASLTGVFGILLEHARIHLNAALFGRYWISRAIVAYGLCTVIVVSNGDISLLLLAHILGLVFAIGLGFRLLPLKAAQWRIKKTFSKKWGIYGYPLAVTYIVDLAVTFSDRTYLALQERHTDLGQYTATYDIAWPLIVMLGLSVVSAALPRIMQEAKSGSDSRILLTGRLYLLLFMPAIPCSLLLGDTLFLHLIGSPFRDSFFNILPIVILAAILHILRIGLIEVGSQSSGKTAIGLQSTVLIVIANVVLNELVGQEFGLRGIVCATALAHLIGLLYSYFRSKKRIREFVDCEFLLKLVGLLAVSITIYSVFETDNAASNTASLVLSMCLYAAAAFWLMRKQDDKQQY